MSSSDVWLASVLFYIFGDNAGQVSSYKNDEKLYIVVWLRLLAVTKLTMMMMKEDHLVPAIVKVIAEEHLQRYKKTMTVKKIDQ